MLATTDSELTTTTSKDMEENTLVPPPSSIKVQNVCRGEKIVNNQATIVVTGIMSGKVHGKNVKIWRAQQANIQAEESIFIAKEIIGSTDLIGEGGAADTNSGVTSITAPEVTIGIAGQQAYCSKELEITTNLLTMHNVIIHNQVTVNLGPSIFRQKKLIEGDPARLKNRIVAILPQLRSDIEDFARRTSRPGNEHIKSIFNDFVSIQNNLFANKVKLFTLLRRLLHDLGIRTSGEILQRWRDRIDAEKELREKQAELDRLHKELSMITMNLSIMEMKKEAFILIRYGDNEYRLPGPLSRTDITIKHTLLEDVVTGLKRGELHIDKKNSD